MRQKEPWLEPAAAYRCEEVWPPGTCTRDIMRAYKWAVDTRLITWIRVFVGGQSGKVTMRYWSVIPEDWLKEAMREYRDGLRLAEAGGRREEK